jgi:positive phototaxis protein PixI
MTNSIAPKRRSNLEPNNLDLPYLQFQLGTDTLAMVPMQNTQEVLTVASRRITVMPNMPHCILGLLNQRSRVIWVADLSQMLEKQGVDRNLQQYHMVIIRVKDLPLGLIVPQIVGVIRLSPETIQSPLGNVSSGLVPYLQGCCLEKERVLLVLDTEAIINSPLLQH